MEKLVVVLFLAFFMFHAGLQCDYRELISALQSRGRMARIFLANFIIVPLLAVILVRVFALDDFLATGILLMAIAPGVPFLSMTAGAKKGGSAGLATALAVLLPAFSVITVPITAPLVLPANAGAHIALASFIINILVIQLLPLCIGLWLRAKAPGRAPAIEKIAMGIIVVTFVGLLIFLVPAVGHAFAVVFGTRALMATLSIVILSGLAGFALGGNTVEYRRTIAIATIMRNLGLALLIAGQNFEGTIVGAVVLSYFVVQFLVANIVGMVMKREGAGLAPA